jgi:hypothetical protein
MSDDDIKVNVGILKTQVLTLSALCSKMDQVIEKLVDQHDRHIAKVYTDMDNRRLETDADVKEIHDRIDIVLDKVQESERRIMEEMKGLKKCLNEHNESSKIQFEKINQWKWTIAGGILVLSWLISHSNLDTIVKSIH